MKLCTSIFRDKRRRLQVEVKWQMQVILDDLIQTELEKEKLSSGEKYEASVEEEDTGSKFSIHLFSPRTSSSS